MSPTTRPDTTSPSPTDHEPTDDVTFAVRPTALFSDGPDDRRADIHHANAFMANSHVQRHPFVTGPGLDAEAAARIDALTASGATDDAALQAVDEYLRSTLSGQVQLIDQRFEYADDILHDVRAQQLANIEQSRGRIAVLAEELGRVQARHGAFRLAILGVGMPPAPLAADGPPIEPSDKA